MKFDETGLLQKRSLEKKKVVRLADPEKESIIKAEWKKAEKKSPKGSIKKRKCSTCGDEGDLGNFFDCTVNFRYVGGTWWSPSNYWWWLLVISTPLPNCGGYAAEIHHFAEVMR